jgi:hypothetical protein
VHKERAPAPIAQERVRRSGKKKLETCSAGRAGAHPYRRQRSARSYHFLLHTNDSILFRASSASLPLSRSGVAEQRSPCLIRKPLLSALVRPPVFVVQGEKPCISEIEPEHRRSGSHPARHAGHPDPEGVGQSVRTPAGICAYSSRRLIPRRSSVIE